MAIIVAECRANEEQAGRIDVVVRDLTGRSRSDIRGLFDHGCVFLNDAPCGQAGTPVQPGDTVVVRHDPHRRYRERPPERTGKVFRLVFEDEHLFVVDKAAPYLTVPTDARESNTLLEALITHARRKNPRARVSVVHRLDRGTSGLLVFGKTPDIAKELQSQFRARKTERIYAAIVAGEIQQQEGTFSSRIGTHRKSLQRFSVRDHEEGESAVTHYRVEQLFLGATQVSVALETGRRNQIRVHFAEAGYPVLGDERYSPDEAQHPAWRARRLALHAAALLFEHPRTRDALHFESPVPEEFERFIQYARKLS